MSNCFLWVVLIICVLIFIYLRYFRKKSPDFKPNPYTDTRTRKFYLKIKGGYKGLIAEFSKQEQALIDTAIVKVSKMEYLRSMVKRYIYDSVIINSFSNALRNNTAFEYKPTGVKFEPIADIPIELKKATEFIAGVIADEMLVRSDEGYGSNIMYSVLELSMLLHKNALDYSFTKILGTGSFNITMLININGLDCCLRALKTVDVVDIYTIMTIEGFLKTHNEIYTKKIERIAPGNIELYESNNPNITKIFFSSCDFMQGYSRTMSQNFFMIVPILKEIDLYADMSLDFMNEYIQSIASILTFITPKNIFYTDFKVENMMKDPITGKILLADVDFVKCVHQPHNIRIPTLPLLKFDYEIYGVTAMTYSGILDEMLPGLVNFKIGVNDIGGNQRVFADIDALKFIALTMFFADIVLMLKFLAFYNSNPWQEVIKPGDVPGMNEEQRLTECKNRHYQEFFIDNCAFGYPYKWELVKLLKDPSPTNIKLILNRPKENGFILPQETLDAINGVVNAFGFNDNTKLSEALAMSDILSESFFERTDIIIRPFEVSNDLRTVKQHSLQGIKIVNTALIDRPKSLKRNVQLASIHPSDTKLDILNKISGLIPKRFNNDSDSSVDNLILNLDVE